jgi:2-phospho-L-lactate guanylyltransferase (CobY/MobA/RfbA family)
MNIDITESEDRCTELIALARLVAFAVESAKSLDAEVAEFCLDKALRAVLDEIDEPARMTLTASDIMLMNRSPLC